MIKLSAVSYTNSLPFVYGLNHYKSQLDFELSLDIPSACAAKLLGGQVDIGLVPVAIIPLLKNAEIISDYCIGSEGKVASVLLVSNHPLTEIDKIYLDYQSRTSVMLCRVLCDIHWQINPLFQSADQNYLNQISKNEAAVVIGDRAFEAAKNFKYQYDLSEAWFNATGLPFVFACWVKRDVKIEPLFLENFNKAIQFGITNREKAIRMLSEKSYQDFLITYVNRFISYNFDNQKQKALETFLKLISKY